MGSMRTYTLILFMIINSMNAALLAADKNAPKTNEVSSGIVINDSLKKLMDIDGVEPIYTACQKNFDAESDSRTEKVIDCLWKGVKKDSKLKKTVQDVYAQELKGAKTTSEGRTPASASTTPLTAKTTNVATDYESDPAVAALTEFYGKKLDAVLNPEVALTDEERKSNTILSVNHRQFIDLYKSELGKTIVSAFTSYCLDTDPATNSCTAAQLATCEADKTNCSCQSFTISDDAKDRKDHREQNIKALKVGDLKTGSGDSDRWQKCILSVTKSCKKDTSTLLSQSETTKRSCLVMDYVNSARKNIIVADEQITFYNEMAKTQTTGIAGNMKEITDLKKVSSDALLEMSSTDVKTALEKPMKEKLKDLEGCYKDGAIVNVAVCKKYLNTNSGENETALAELGMRQIAQEAILEEELGSSDQKVRDYLKEEGYSANEIKEMTADKASIAEVKDQILKRYANQKAAIIKEMADRIQTKTAVAEGTVTPKGDISKLDKVKAELESRSTDLQNLVYFNNVVSSYLQIDDGKGKLTRNTASLFAEANSLEKEQSKLIKEQIKNADLKDQKGAANTTNLDVNTINSNFLNYKEKEKKK